MDQVYYRINVIPYNQGCCQRKYKAQSKCKYCGATGSTSDKSSISSAKEWAVRNTVHGPRCALVALNPQ